VWVLIVTWELIRQNTVHDTMYIIIGNLECWTKWYW